MKRIRASAVETACEVPVGKIVNPTAAEADKRLAFPATPAPGQLGAHKPHFEADLAHLARLAALGEMLTGIAHEINHPSSRLQNYARASIVSLTQPGPLDRDKLVALDAADRARRPTAPVPSSAGCAISAATHPLARPATTFANSCRRRWISCFPTCDLRKIAIELHLDEKARTLYADRIQIQQVLVNLLKNACEAIDISGDSSGQITIRTRLETGWVRFSVSDTGGGLPPVDRSKLFEPFFTTKPTAWESAWPSAGRSSKRPMDGCGQSPTHAAGPSFISPFPQGQR